MTPTSLTVVEKYVDAEHHRVVMKLSSGEEVYLNLGSDLCHGCKRPLPGQPEELHPVHEELLASINEHRTKRLKHAHAYAEKNGMEVRYPSQKNKR